MKSLFLAGSLLGFALLAHAQDAAPEAAPETASAGGLAPFRLVVSYDRPGLEIPHWQITVPPHGMAEYTGRPAKGLDPGQVLFPLSGQGRARLGALMGRTHNLQPCETHSKGIANMGTKEVEYAAADGTPVHCAFNFTDNKPLNDALDYMLAIAGTVQTGLELERLHRFDRLGLDPVMIRLTEDVKAGRAAELGAIRPTLESLATDVAVLERVRTRAHQLLTMVDQQESGTR